MFELCSDTSQPINFYFSTSPFLNSLFSSSVRTPIFRTAEIDDNNDGLSDRLEVSANLPVAANEKITGVSCAVYFDVQLNSIAKYLFDAVIFANYESGTPIAKLDMEGDMKIRLSWPLSAYGGYKTPYQNDPLFPAFKFGTSAEEFYLDVITRKSNNRNSTCISRSAHACTYLLTKNDRVVRCCA